MFIGPDRNGALLEVGVLDFDGDDPVIIHAMAVRHDLSPALVSALTPALGTHT